MFSSLAAAVSESTRGDAPQVKVGLKGEFILNFEVHQFEVLEIHKVTSDTHSVDGHLNGIASADPSSDVHEVKVNLLRTLFPYLIRHNRRPAPDAEEYEETKVTHIGDEWVYLDLQQKFLATPAGFETTFTQGHRELEHPFPKANCCQRLFFTWVAGIIQVGTRRAITLADLPVSTDDDAAASVTGKVQKAWDEQARYFPAMHQFGLCCRFVEFVLWFIDLATL